MAGTTIRVHRFPQAFMAFLHEVAGNKNIGELFTAAIKAEMSGELLSRRRGFGQARPSIPQELLSEVKTRAGILGLSMSRYVYEAISAYTMKLLQEAAVEMTALAVKAERSKLPTTKNLTKQIKKGDLSTDETELLINILLSICSARFVESGSKGKSSASKKKKLERDISVVLDALRYFVAPGDEPPEILEYYANDEPLGPVDRIPPDAIKARIKLAGIQIKDMAQRIGITRSFLSQYLNSYIDSKGRAYVISDEHYLKLMRLLKEAESARADEEIEF